MDLEEKRVVSYEEGVELASKLGIDFFEVSAKDSKNIDEIFYNLTRKYFLEKKDKKKKQTKKGCVHN
jgi:GTPase SAR1 family protein